MHGPMNVKYIVRIAEGLYVSKTVEDFHRNRQRITNVCDILPVQIL